MHTLEVTTTQLLMLHELINNDIELSKNDTPDYADTMAMQYYLDRCQVYHLVSEGLGA